MWLLTTDSLKRRWSEWASVVFVALAACGCGNPAPPPPESPPHQNPAEQIKLFVSHDPVVRLLAIDNLKRLGARAKEAIPELEKLEDDPHFKVRAAAKGAISAIQVATSKNYE